MNSFKLIPNLILFIIFIQISRRLSTAAETPPNYSFIYEQITKCQKLEEKRLEFEERKAEEYFEWAEIEPKNELEKCILKLNINRHLEETKNQFTLIKMKLIRSKAYPLAPKAEYFLLKALSDKLEPLVLKKDSMKLLRAKFAKVLFSNEKKDEEENKPIGNIFRINMENAQKEIEEEEQPAERTFTINFLGDKTELERIDEGDENEIEEEEEMEMEMELGGENDEPIEVKSETIDGRLKILFVLYNFRRLLNNEVKWLNLMLWLRKSKKFVENLAARLQKQKREIGLELRECIIRQFSSRKPKGKIQKLMERMKICTNKKIKKIREILGRNKKEWEEKVKEWEKELKEIKLKVWKWKNWPKFEEMLKRVEFVLENRKIEEIDFRVLNKEVASDWAEERAVELLRGFVKYKINPRVRRAHAEVERQLDENANQEYLLIWHFAALNRVSSLMMTLIMGIFGWNQVEWRLGQLWLLGVENLLEYFKFVAKNGKDGKNALMDELMGKFPNWSGENPLELIREGELNDENVPLIRGENARGDVALDALRVQSFFERIEEFHQIGKNYGMADGRDVEKEFGRMRNALNKFVMEKLPPKRLAQVLLENFSELL